MRETVAKRWTVMRRVSIWAIIIRISESDAVWTTRCANSTWPDVAKLDPDAIEIGAERERGNDEEVERWVSRKRYNPSPLPPPRKREK